MSRRLSIALILLLCIALCFALATVCAAEKDDDQKVTLDQCPTAVQKTLNEQAKGGTIDEIEKETEDGKVIYSAEITKDGKTYDVEVGEDGTLIKSEADDEDDDASEVEENDDD